MITLVLGGTRSGKSAIAEALATREPAVTYVATGIADGDDAFTARIAAHRARRPAGWSTVEIAHPGDLPAVLSTTTDAVLVDALGTWVARHPDPLDADPGPLVAALRARTAPSIVVAEEVGASIHPPTAIGRAFVDALGRVNQAVSAVADRALLVVAGRAIELPPPGAPPC